MTFHPTILESRQKALLEQLTFFRPFGFYLGGGTALALQLGHRTSLDLDFYSNKKLESEKIATRFKQSFPLIRISRQTEDTFQGIIEGVNVSVFYYPYPLVKKKIRHEVKKYLEAP